MEKAPKHSLQKIHFLVYTIYMAFQNTPFSRGVNFTKWFEEDRADTIIFSKYSEQDFINAKSLGVDVIRLPIALHNMTLGKPDFSLDPQFLKLLDTAVEWAEKHELYLIIDNHSFDPIKPTSDSIDNILLKVWAQIAARYKSRSKYIIYEILNEPHGISDKRWGEIQGAAIKTIRKFDKKHSIIVGGTDYNSIDKMFSIPEYTDSNLIYTFHFYDPHIFTHQGARWGNPSFASLAGVPFPYDRARMPVCPDDLKETWAAESLADYEHESAFSSLRATLNRVTTFSKKRNVPVFCGEFGVYMVQCPAEDRVRWYAFISAELKKRNIPWTCWDYYHGFGLFQSLRSRDFKTKLNTDIVRALGFTPPY